jgi:hypothetical protein
MQITPIRWRINARIMPMTLVLAWGLPNASRHPQRSMYNASAGYARQALQQA